MTIAKHPRRCQYTRHCGDDAFEPTPEGYWFCPEHKLQFETEQQLFEADCEFDEIGRSKTVMRKARAM